MKKYIIIIGFWILSLWVYGQDQHNSTITFPDYPGGYTALKSYLYHHFKDQYQIDINQLHDTLYIEFIVEADGRATSIHCLNNNLSPDMQQAFRETIEHMPKWYPGTNSEGVPSRFRFVLTI
jgi:hypothetical protein